MYGYNRPFPQTAEKTGELTETISGAGNGVRTRDPKLGKLVLCQLSYTRSLTHLREKYISDLMGFVKKQQRKCRELEILYYSLSIFGNDRLTG